jgi:hypothetical protein
MKVAIDVDALYRRAFGRLDDVGRLIDEFRQIRAAKANGKGNGDGADPTEDDEEAEDTDDEDEVTARCMPVDDR